MLIAVPTSILKKRLLESVCLHTIESVSSKTLNLIWMDSILNLRGVYEYIQGRANKISCIVSCTNLQ